MFELNNPWRKSFNPRPTGPIRFYLCFWVFSSLFLKEAQGTFNFYMNTEEVKRILGLSKELYYVREGVVNVYALNFIVLIPAHITTLHFTWETLGQKPLPYSISVDTSDPIALHKPSLNIPPSGTIPTSPQTFQINLPCSGFRSTEVLVELSLNVTANPKFRANEITSVVLKRKKVCLEGRPDPPGPPPPPLAGSSPNKNEHLISTSSKSGSLGSGSSISKGLKSSSIPGSKNASNKNLNPKLEDAPFASIDDHQFLVPSHQQPSTILYIILGSSLGLILILLAIVFTAYLRTRNSSVHSTGFLHVDTSLKSSTGSGSGSGSTSSGCCDSTSNRTGTGTLFNIVRRSESPHHYSTVSPCLDSGSYTYSTFLHNGNGIGGDQCHNHGGHYSEISTSTLASNSSKLADITVERCKVRLVSVIMEGSFAKLYRGTVQEIDGSESKVIIKTVNDHSSPVQMALLLHEGLSLVGIVHKHVNSVIGVAAEERVPPFLIYADDSSQNLKKFLQNCRSGPGRPITPQEIVWMGIQIASGIAFLHRQNVIHRDIAARNVVVNDKFGVKLSDGALSRDLFPEDYQWMGEAETRAVKWCPPESILQSRTSFAADIWSFGVTLWELATLAQQPFTEVDTSDLFPFLKMGYRLSQPVNCPDELYGIMSSCWTWDADDRPKWTNVIPELQSLHIQLDQYV